MSGTSAATPPADAGAPASAPSPTLLPGPFDFGMQAFTEFWTEAGKAMVQAQETAARAFGEAMKAAPGVASLMTPGMMPGMAPGLLPGMPGTAGGTGGAADGSAMAKAAQAVTELWTATAGMSGTIAQALAQSGIGRGTPDAGVESSFRVMMDPRSWLAGVGGLDSVVGRVAEGPQLADLWQSERLQARMAQAWLEARRRGLEHNAVVLEAWLRAAKAFSEELTGRTRAEGRAPEGKALLALWTETANRILLETQRSEPFLRTQAAMIRAGTELRMAQRALAERWADAFDMPTRTELDDVHRTLTELRREVRRLRREAKQGADGQGHDGDASGDDRKKAGHRGRASAQHSAHGE